MSSPTTHTYTAQSTVAELPGFAAAFDVATKGAEIARIFEEQPELPGIILIRQGLRVAALSQTQFLRVISRPFGIELFYGRPIEAMVAVAEAEIAVLPSECTIQEAVERCLNRSPREMYEPFLVENEFSGLAHIVDFRTLLHASSQISVLRNQQMDRILSAVAEGLLTVEPDLTIGPEYSKALEGMFERTELAHVPLLDVLAQLLDAKTCQEARDYLGVLFNPRMIDRLIEGVNPLKEVVATFPATESAPAKNKHFSVRFRRMKTKRRVNQVLMRVEDVTRQVMLAKELEQQNARVEEQMKSIMQVIHADPHELGAFLQAFDERLLEAAEWVQRNTDALPAGERVNRIYRTIHSLKGEAGVLRLSTFQERLHRYEEEIEKMRRGGLNGDTRPEALSALVPGLADLMRIAEETKEAIGQFQKLSLAMSTPEAMNGGSGARTPDPIKAVRNTISEVATRVSKEVAFHSAVQVEEIPEAYRGLLREALIQLARNSLVHGIESAEERQQAGKPAIAHLQLAARVHPAEQMFEVVFQDDGRGLNLEKLRARAAEMGWTRVTDDEVREVIFEPGFSTASETTMDAGRGVGLDLVKQNIEAVGGRICVHSHPGAYCAFQILLPVSLPAEQPL